MAASAFALCGGAHSGFGHGRDYADEQWHAAALLLFTGDIGRVRNSTIAPGKVVHSGPTEGESPDVLVMESTYGNRHHPHQDVMPVMAELIRTTVKRGGSIVVPAFAVERTQKFLFLLQELMENKQIPQIPVYADSPMGIHAVQIFLKHSEEFSEETKDLIARHGSPLKWPGFHFAARRRNRSRSTIADIRR